ncbi:hypothetical protein DHX103_14425 [Planococcus sp. X10-3]|uniref:hypothetical protein n=1 Tax=Planococcus sp. X10-3 TaxID=3061240 RepID=UPI003BAEFE48
MENKQMIGTAISMLKGIDPKTIEVINFDRTAYDDGSVGFSINITTPATRAIPLTEAPKAETDLPVTSQIFMRGEPVQLFSFQQTGRYAVIDLGSPDGAKRDLSISGPIRKVYLTDEI